MIAPGPLRAIADRVGLDRAAIRLLDLENGALTCCDGGEAPYPASMIKTPLAVAAAAAVAAGRLAWCDTVVVSAANMTANDAPSPLEPGYRATVRELAERMVSRSDNVATNELFDLLDRARAGADLAALGFGETAFRRKLSGALPLIDDPGAAGRNTHAPRDAATLFERIARRDVPGAAFIESLLAAQHWNTKLSRGLRPGDRFAHKTGDTDEVSHDGGILTLESGERFVLVVYTGLGANDETDERFGAFMRELRPLLTYRPRA